MSISNQASNVFLEAFQNIVRTYGFLGSVSDYILEDLGCNKSGLLLVPSESDCDLSQYGIACHEKPGGEAYYSGRGFRLGFSRSVCYKSLLPHQTFTGDCLQPIWVNRKGQILVAWYRGQGADILLIGLNVIEEIVRYRQGDPNKVGTAQFKGGFGFGFERANYLFEDQIGSKYTTHPWVDYLGFLLAEALSQISGYPLIEPLPMGARGAVILTGDDDQAFLEKYDEQLKLINGLPITYMLVPQTKHTLETLAQLPTSVELGLHPDALEKPEEYDRLCAEQTVFIRQLSGREIRTVRNHGYLSRGYLGHLKAWEANGLALDVNYSLADGTVMTGSLLPMQSRHLDGSWSNHYSLLTAFGDGMVFALKWSERKAAKKIRKLARQIEKTNPGVLVFNFHPQNIDSTRKLHREVLRLAHCSDWVALGLESYLRWIEALNSLDLKDEGQNTFSLQSNYTIHDLTYRYIRSDRWHKKTLKPWTNRVEFKVKSF